jgi:hypothetical protein
VLRYWDPRVVFALQQLPLEVGDLIAECIPFIGEHAIAWLHAPVRAQPDFPRENEILDRYLAFKNLLPRSIAVALDVAQILRAK